MPCALRLFFCPKFAIVRDTQVGRANRAGSDTDKILQLGQIRY